MNKITVAIIFFIIGISLGFFVKTFLKFPSSDWIMYKDIPLKGDNSSLGYKTEALFDVDIPLPEIKKFDAKIKFIPSLDDNDKEYLGYIVYITVDDLNKKDIPLKYQKDKKFKEGWTRPAVEEVTYEIEMEFDLKNKDGFKLIKITGDKDIITSGQVNTIQGKTHKSISKNLLDQIDTIKPYITVTQCNTCE